MLNVQNYRITSPRISFQANEETGVTQEKKVNKPYKTHAGIKTGAVYGGLEAIGGLLMGAPLYSLAVIPVALLCGNYVDNKINNQNAELSKKINTQDRKEIIEQNPNVESTRNGNLYNKPNIGKKAGAILGAIAMPVLNIIQKGKHTNVLGLIISPIGGALGGLLLGAITDACASKGAKEAADKQAFRANV